VGGEFTSGWGRVFFIKPLSLPAQPAHPVHTQKTAQRETKLARAKSWQRRFAVGVRAEDLRASLPLEKKLFVS